MKTIRYFFSQQGLVTDDFDLVINGRRPDDAVMMRQLDLYNDQHIVFKVVRHITID